MASPEHDRDQDPSGADLRLILANFPGTTLATPGDCAGVDCECRRRALDHFNPVHLQQDSLPYRVRRPTRPTSTRAT